MVSVIVCYVDVKLFLHILTWRLLLLICGAWTDSVQMNCIEMCFDFFGFRHILTCWGHTWTDWRRKIKRVKARSLKPHSDWQNMKEGEREVCCFLTSPGHQTLTGATPPSHQPLQHLDQTPAWNICSGSDGKPDLYPVCGAVDTRSGITLNLPTSALPKQIDLVFFFWTDVKFLFISEY